MVQQMAGRTAFSQRHLTVVALPKESEKISQQKNLMGYRKDLYQASKVCPFLATFLPNLSKLNEQTFFSGNSH